MSTKSSPTGGEIIVWVMVSAAVVFLLILLFPPNNSEKNIKWLDKLPNQSATLEYWDDGACEVHATVEADGHATSFVERVDKVWCEDWDFKKRVRGIIEEERAKDGAQNLGENQNPPYDVAPSLQSPSNCVVGPVPCTYGSITSIPEAWTQPLTK